jgi:hypothetical protein
MSVTAPDADFLEIIAPDVVENGTCVTATVRAFSDAAHSFPFSLDLLPYAGLSFSPRTANHAALDSWRVTAVGIGAIRLEVRASKAALHSAR